MRSAMARHKAGKSRECVCVCGCVHVTQDCKQSEHLKAGTQRTVNGSEGTDRGSLGAEVRAGREPAMSGG